MVTVVFGGKYIHIALYVPDGTHLALPSHVVEAAVETLDKAAEPAVGVVLDGHRQQIAAGEGGKHHLEGGKAAVYAVGVRAHDGDGAAGLIGGDGHQIGVVFAVYDLVVGGEQVVIGLRLRRGGIRRAFGTVDSQQDVRLTGGNLVRLVHGQAVARENLAQESKGIGVDTLLRNHVHR